MIWTRPVRRNLTCQMLQAHGIIIGALIGGIITWWVYRMQNKTSEKQETIIENIDMMVKKMERQEEKHRAHQDEVLNKILSLDSKIDSILEKKYK